jgi:hypothetical protein
MVLSCYRRKNDGFHYIVTAVTIAPADINIWTDLAVLQEGHSAPQRST